MPLLRRPHDHCRKLRARRRTSRSAVTPSQQRHCHVMTPVAASPHIPPAEEPRFRRCIAVAPPSPKAHAASSIRPKSPPRPLPQRQNRYCNPRFAADHGSQRISHPSRRTAKSPWWSTAAPAARGFLPGGLSDAGPQRLRTGHDGPASETLHHSRPSARLLTPGTCRRTSAGR